MALDPDVRDHIPLEQGLRPRSVASKWSWRSVRDHIPLEQGLRPHPPLWWNTTGRQRPYSIRTRIKTRNTLIINTSTIGQRPYSIRTRIKTSSHDEPHPKLLVRDHIPLEQGLRPCWQQPQIYAGYVRDHIPLEQGLRLLVSFMVIMQPAGQRPYSIRTRIKTVSFDIDIMLFNVRDHIPLEQGLRPESIVQARHRCTVRDHIPLEQGLRLSLPHCASPRWPCQRPYSIRTRIKTSRDTVNVQRSEASETIFH